MNTMHYKGLLVGGLSLFGLSLSWAGNGPGAPAGPSQPPVEPVFDTSYAIEASDSCLGGGCHETNQHLVAEYGASFMTHVMVKCNACHGTHTADMVGEEKPNLTGYYPGIGPTGYSVGRDRCLACHNDQHLQGAKARNDCKSCHLPHMFD